MEGFSGKACQKSMCNNECFRRGRCMSYKDMSDTTMNSLSLKFVYDEVWDADKVSFFLFLFYRE